jgi:Tfp pilus assembly protein PilN
MPNIFNMQMLLLLLLLYADPERPKNNKATILSDSIQVLKDLNAEVNRLKAEYTSLSEESREVKLQLET